jgi:hypothetical protein
MDIKSGGSIPSMPQTVTLIATKLQKALSLLSQIVAQGKIVTVAKKKVYCINLDLIQDIKTFLQG